MQNIGAMSANHCPNGLAPRQMDRSTGREPARLLTTCKESAVIAWTSRLVLRALPCDTEGIIRYGRGLPSSEGFAPRNFVASRITMTSFLGAGGVALLLQAGTQAAQYRSASRTV